jgi:hypothetical protein
MITKTSNSQKSLFLWVNYINFNQKLTQNSVFRNKMHIIPQCKSQVASFPVSHQIVIWYSNKIHDIAFICLVLVEPWTGEYEMRIRRGWSFDYFVIYAETGPTEWEINFICIYSRLLEFNNNHRVWVNLDPLQTMCSVDWSWVHGFTVLICHLY